MAKSVTHADEFRKAVLDNRARVIAREPRIDAMAQRFVDSTTRDWIAELRRATGGRILSSSEMADIRRKVATLRQANRKITAQNMSALRKEVTRLTTRTFVTETVRHYGMMGTLQPIDSRLRLSFHGLNEGAIRAALADRVPLTKLTQSFAGVSQRVQQAMGRDVARAIAEGWKVDQLAESWARKRTGSAASMIANEARSLARTSVMLASSQAQLHSYQQSGLAKGVIWEATFDSRTCMTCSSLHNKRFVFGTEPPQPAHENCRCTWLMWFSDPEANAELDSVEAYRLPDGKTGFRQSDRSFDGFLRKQDAQVQEMYFPSKLKRAAWRTGKLGIEEMVRPDGTPMSDSQIAAMLNDNAFVEKYNPRALTARSRPSGSGGLLTGPFDDVEL